MNPRAAQNSVSETRSAMKLSMITNALLAGVILVMVFQLNAARNAERVVQQTPDGDTSRWISATSGPSRQKLVDAGVFVSHLTLDISPGSAKTNGELLQTWLAPSEWDSMRRKVEKAAADMLTTGGVQNFNPLYMTPDPENLRVALTGELRRWINNVPIPMETRTYVYIFRQDSTRLVLHDWYESSKDKPFERLKTPEQDDSSTHAK